MFFPRLHCFDWSKKHKKAPKATLNDLDCSRNGSPLKILLPGWAAGRSKTSFSTSIRFCPKDGSTYSSSERHRQHDVQQEVHPRNISEAHPALQQEGAQGNVRQTGSCLNHETQCWKHGQGRFDGRCVRNEPEELWARVLPGSKIFFVFLLKKIFAFSWFSNTLG